MIMDVSEPPVINTNVPHPARVYDYWLDGKDHFEADRIAGRAAKEIFPHTVESARAGRAYLRRVVRFLAGEAGIRQFLDIGTGLPSGQNVHEVAQDIAADSRIVYVDNDPIVLAHARALLTSSPEGKTSYIDADLRDTDRILREASRTLDFSEPVAVMLLAVLHFVADEQDPAGIIRTLLRAVPAGSYLAIGHHSADLHPEMVEFAKRMSDMSPGFTATMRDRATITGFFDGLELVPPGVVPVSEWRPDSAQTAAQVSAIYGGVARKEA
jgi:hypothetical protein